MVYSYYVIIITIYYGATKFDYDNDFKYERLLEIVRKKIL